MMFDDLEERCNNCDGTGKINNPRPQPDLKDMAQEWGKPEWQRWKELVGCKQCDGKGWILTPEGKVLVAFIHKWQMDTNTYVAPRRY